MPASRGHAALAVAILAAAGLALGLLGRGPHLARSSAPALVQVAADPRAASAPRVQSTHVAALAAAAPSLGSGVQAAGIWSTPAEFAPPE